ncbi:MAG TPA: hypothetical protein EYQ27_11735 [Gemmatimonadetes bacterium]|nr:hypothetical protein [Gemmatimonadota bacterium]
MHRRSATLLFVPLLLLTACASAGDRLSDGVRLQAEGRYMEAAYRYADAVDKDGTLDEARQRLLAAADTALQHAMESAAGLTRGGDPISAGHAFLAGDRLLRRIQQVGVRFSPPDGYDVQRRDAFDGAIEALMSYGEVQRDRGQFSDARRAFVRARSDFGATSAQRNASFEAEAQLLLLMADAALSEGANRTAYDFAAEVLELRPNASRATTEEVVDIQAAALERGTVRVAVLPITSVADVREQVGTDFENQLSDDLELDYWRDPPLFVAVADPVLLRRAVRDIARGSGRISARDLERLMGSFSADFAALIEFNFVQIQESNIEREQRSARTNRGVTVGYTIEKGRISYEAMVQVIIVDDRGDEIVDFNVSARETGRFERGVYRGNPAELDLGRNEARLFDPEAIAAQLNAIEQEMMTELASNVAGRTFARVLSRVR